MSPPVFEVDHYNTLGVDFSSTPEDLKRAYRKLVMRYNPEKSPKNGLRKLREFTKVYEVLSDPDKRRLYDLGGSSAVERGYLEGTENLKTTKTFFDQIESMYESMMLDDEDQTKCVEKIHHLAVKLNELYLGATHNIEVRRRLICETCRGTGKNARRGQCGTCHGERMYYRMAQLTVQVERGMREGGIIVLEGEGDQDPDLEPGDVLVSLVQIDHAVFKRSGRNDLSTEIRLNLVEALTGFTKIIETLDDRRLKLTVPPGEVVAPGSYKCIDGEGMPDPKYPDERGKLIIKFVVEFPKIISQELVDQIRGQFPEQVPEVAVAEGAEDCNAVDFEPDGIKSFGIEEDAEDLRRRRDNCVLS